MKKLFALLLALVLMSCAVLSLAEDWTCASCGTLNGGKFCAECGAPNTQNAEWTCSSCGTLNAGKFCAECGTPKSGAVKAEAPVQVKNETNLTRDDLKVGREITFGTFEQDNNLRNGTEPITWIVLQVEGERALITSKYGLTAMPYFAEFDDCTWESCTLRTWLNSTFFTNAFTPAERAVIAKTEIANDHAQHYKKFLKKVPPQPDTRDNVFLLSYAEVCKFFYTKADRTLYPTEYAKAQNAQVDTKRGGTCLWWARSPGESVRQATVFDSTGCVGTTAVSSARGTVRPAMWIALNAL